jgi:hypothetical protein
LWVKQEPTHVKHLSGAPFKGRLLALSTNNRLGFKGLPGSNTLAYYENYGRKKFYNVGPWRELSTEMDKTLAASPTRQITIWEKNLKCLNQRQLTIRKD